MNRTWASVEKMSPQERQALAEYDYDPTSLTFATWEDEKREWTNSAAMPGEVPKRWAKGQGQKAGRVPLWDVDIPATLALAKTDEHEKEGECWLSFYKPQKEEYRDEFASDDDAGFLEVDLERHKSPNLKQEDMLRGRRWSALRMRAGWEDPASSWARSFYAKRKTGFAVVEANPFEGFVGNSVLPMVPEQRTSLSVDVGELVRDDETGLCRPKNPKPKVVSKSGRHLLNVFYQKQKYSRQTKNGDDAKAKNESDDMLRALDLDPNTGLEKLIRLGTSAENVAPWMEGSLFHLFAFHLAETYPGVGTPDSAYNHFTRSERTRAIQRRNANRKTVYRRAAEIQLTYQTLFVPLLDDARRSVLLNANTKGLKFGKSRAVMQDLRDTMNKLWKAHPRIEWEYKRMKRKTKQAEPPAPSFFHDWQWVLEHPMEWEHTRLLRILHRAEKAESLKAKGLRGASTQR